MPERRDTWETDQGLPDDFDFRITRATFGYRAEYMEGQVALLIWEGESDSEDVGDIIWPCGKGWEVINNGARVKHIKRVRFIKTSLMGKLIDRVVNQLAVDMRSRGEATEAKVWNGLGFHMKREEFDYGSSILEDRGGKTTHLMPVAVIQRQATSTAEAGPGKPVDSVTGIDSMTGKKLALLASKLSRQEFQKKAMDLPEVIDSPLLADVLDDGPNGFWAQHQQK